MSSILDIDLDYFNLSDNSEQQFYERLEWGLIMDSRHTRSSVLSVAMCMEQMDPTCTKDDVQNVRKGLRGSSTGGFPTAKCIRS